MKGSLMPEVRLCLLVALLAVGACTSNPLGIDDEEWSQLSPQQKALAESKQAELLETRVDNPSGLLIVPEPVGRAMDEGRQLRVDERRRRDRFGDTLVCRMDDVAATFAGRWSVAHPAEVAVIRGEFLPISLFETESEERAVIWMDYSDSGNTLRLCSGVSERGDFRGCATMVASFRDLTDGMQWQVSLPDVLQSTLKCAFKPGVPVTVITPGN